MSDIDNLALAETWLDADATILIPGYNFIHSCTNDERGGGVDIFIWSGTAFHQIEADRVMSKTCSYESMFVKIKKKTKRT